MAFPIELPFFGLVFFMCILTQWRDFLLPKQKTKIGFWSCHLFYLFLKGEKIRKKTMCDSLFEKKKKQVHELRMYLGVRLSILEGMWVNHNTSLGPYIYRL